MGPVRPCLVSAWSGHNSRRLGVDGDGSPARGRGGGLRAGAAQEGQPARRPCPQECLDKRRLELVAHLPVSLALSPACRGSWTAPRPALLQPASRRSPRLATFSAAEPAVASWRTQTAHLILHPSPQHPPQSRARRPRGAGELGLPGGSWGVPGVLTLGGVGGKAEGPGEGVSNCPGQFPETTQTFPCRGSRLSGPAQREAPRKVTHVPASQAALTWHESQGSRQAP